MLTQLRLAGVLDRVAGVLLGDFHVGGTSLASEHAPMQRVLEERLAHLDVPVACGLPFGHRPRSWTLPFGARAQLDVRARSEARLRAMLEAQAAKTAEAQSKAEAFREALEVAQALRGHAGAAGGTMAHHAGGLGKLEAGLFGWRRSC